MYSKAVMMMTNRCTDCQHFIGYDGVNELWTYCNLLGDFKGSKKDCKHFKKRITKSDLLREIKLLDAFLVEKGLAEEFVRWKNE